MRIGLDFDNTIVGYDDVFRAAARTAKLVPETFAGGKTEIKSFLLARPGGDVDWMRLQGQVYGALMGQAVMVKGVDSFLHRARRSGAHVFIVSHKTMHGHFDRERTNLRDVARAWLSDNGFFAGDGFGIPPDHLYFEDSRAAKVARIAELKLDVFVDDLPEVFEETGFPATTRKILFAVEPQAAGPGALACPDWAAVGHAVFGGRD